MNHPLIKYILKNQLIAGIIIVMFLLLIIELKEVLIIFFLSYTIMAALIPFARFFQSRGLPKTIAVLITYLFFVIFIIMLIVPLVPFFAKQVQSLVINFPKYTSQAALTLGINASDIQIKEMVTSELSTLQNNAFIVTSKVFGGFFSMLAVIVISFYLSLNHYGIRKNITGWFSKNTQEKVNQTIDKVEDKLGSWVRGQVVLSLSIGILTGIALSILGLNYILPLAVIAGILEIIPTIGPILSAVPAVIVALVISPTLALSVIIVYILVQFFENHVLVPNIMQKSVGLNPVVIIMTIMIGGKLLGILGALLSIPFVSMLIIIFNSSKETGQKISED